MGVAQETCFVVTGFGLKTDFRTGRVLDLDQTFRQLVQPACDAAGINAFRAIDANLTGSIDAIMYQWLYRADYVIADLSTLNANVCYELGVRHAQCPNTTVMIAEKTLMSFIPFDLGSFVIHAYEHGGSRIAAAEARRFVALLSGVLLGIRRDEASRLAQTRPAARLADSPVFTAMPGMVRPSYDGVVALDPPPYVPPGARQGPELDEDTSLAEIIELAERAKSDSRFAEAKDLFTEAIARQTGGEASVRPDLFLVQRLALVTYKEAERGDADRARAGLSAAEELLRRHALPERTTDPETLGLMGAIYKRLHELDGNAADLDRAIGYTERGFHIRQDYYNGINLAFLLTLQAAGEEDAVEALICKGYADRIRMRVVDICTGLLDADPERADLDWVLLALAEAYHGLGRVEEQRQIERRAHAEEDRFSANSYRAQRARLAHILATAQARRESGIALESAGVGNAGAAMVIRPALLPGRKVARIDVSLHIDYE